MSFSIGIVGLPNVGKSTLFKALTKKQVAISNYPFTTIDPNIAVVEVPDERLKKLADLLKPKKTTPTNIEFVDIAGLVKGAHKGEGLGNQFLANIKEVDAILEVVRIFKDPNVSHQHGTVDPKNDVEIVNTELSLKDLETIEKILKNTRKEIKSGDKNAARILEVLEMLEMKLKEGKPILETCNLKLETKHDTELNLSLKELQLLSTKPVIYVLNIEEKENLEKLKDEFQVSGFRFQEVNIKLEEEMTELNDGEIKELGLESNLENLIKSCYDILNLITFYTIKGGRELRAWTTRIGTKAPQAGGIVHSDFEEKFIRAELINAQKLIEAGSWQEAREKGWLRTEGKDYYVQDGDVIEFKI